MAPSASSAAASPSIPRLPLWATLCFLISGGAGLLYEVVWSKELSLVLGNTLQSVATVVAAFLTGLALGASVLGVRLARRRDGARLYGRLEIGIAVLGVLSVPVLRSLDPAWGFIYNALGAHGSAFHVVRFALLFVLLLPPTLLMGATLPVLVAHFEFDAVGPALARLYAINTAGAVAGSVLGGFVLVPGVGLVATSWAAAALNLVAGLTALGAARFSRTPVAPAAAQAASTTARAAPAPTSASAPAASPVALGPAPAATSAPFVPVLPPGTRTVVAWLFALSGFAALAFQIAWVRLFGLLLGSSVYSFSAVLAVYLGGLSLGSALAARLTSGPRLLARFALLQLAIALVAIAALRLFPWLPEALFALGERCGARWALFYLGELGLVATVLLIPCVLLGAVFPVAARLIQSRDGGHATGHAYAVNTAGTLAGSLLAGFMLIPSLGVQGTHMVAAAVSGATGLIALTLAAARRESSARALRVGGASAAIAALLALSAPHWDPALMSAGVYRPREAQRIAQFARLGGGSETGDEVARGAHMTRTLFYREGLNGSVYVGTDTSRTQLWIKIGGKVDASTADMWTQVLSGLLPAACSRRGARTAVIGIGSGVTVSAVLAAGVGRTDVVEIEQAVVEASRLFHSPGHQPLDDPRVRLFVTDGRTHLAYSRERYDLVISEPSNPWIAGINNLFTVDFYQRVRARLEPDGVFCQWLQLYELSPETLHSLLASFLTVFPTGQAFEVPGEDDLLLLAMPRDRSLSLERLRTPAALRELSRAAFLGPEAVAAFYACPFDSLLALAAHAPLNRDDLPVVEYRAPRDLYRVGRADPGGRSPGTSVPHVGFAASGLLFTDWTPAIWHLARTRQLARMGYWDRALTAARSAENPALVAELVKTVETGRDRHAVASLQAEARQAALGGRMHDAAQALARAATLDSTNGRTWVLLAEAERQLRQRDGSRIACARALAVGDSADRGDAEMIAGLVEIESQRPREAAAHFHGAQRWRPRSAQPYIFEARALRDAGTSSAAAAACRRGLGMASEDGGLSALLTEISASADSGARR